MSGDPPLPFDPPDAPPGLYPAPPAALAARDLAGVDPDGDVLLSDADAPASR